MSKIQRVTSQYTPGGGFGMALSAMGAANSVGIRPPAINGLVELQALGMSNDSFTVNVPAIAAGATVDVPYIYKPSSKFPVNFLLVTGATGFVFADLTLPTLPIGCGLLGYSKSLVFAIGPPQNPGSTYWSLVERQTYQGASIQGSLRFFSPAGCDSQTLTVVGWILLLCVPPTVTN